MKNYLSHIAKIYLRLTSGTVQSATTLSKTNDNVGKGLKSNWLHRQYSTKTQRAEFAKIHWSVLGSKNKKPLQPQ